MYSLSKQVRYPVLTRKSRDLSVGFVWNSFEEKCNDFDETAHQLPLYKASPFYSHFSNMYQNVTDSSESVEPNEFYCTEFLDLLLKKYMPYCPIWTALLRPYHKCNRLSNAYVENYFWNLKLNILHSEQNLKASRFVRKSRENVHSIYKALKLEIPQMWLTRQKKLVDTASETSCRESWIRKRVQTFFRTLSFF